MDGLAVIKLKPAVDKYPRRVYSMIRNRIPIWGIM